MPTWLRSLSGEAISKSVLHGQGFWRLRFRGSSFFDEPTRGVELVGAKSRYLRAHRWPGQIKAQGLLLISSEMNELVCMGGTESSFCTGRKTPRFTATVPIGFSAQTDRGAAAAGQEGRHVACRRERNVWAPRGQVSESAPDTHLLVRDLFGDVPKCRSLVFLEFCGDIVVTTPGFAAVANSSKRARGQVAVRVPSLAACG